MVPIGPSKVVKYIQYNLLSTHSASYNSQLALNLLFWCRSSTNIRVSTVTFRCSLLQFNCPFSSKLHNKKFSSRLWSINYCYYFIWFDAFYVVPCLKIHHSIIYALLIVKTFSFLFFSSTGSNQYHKDLILTRKSFSRNSFYSIL